MKTCSPVATALLGVALSVVAMTWTDRPAAAQVGTSQPTGLRSVNAHHPFPTRAVWPHEVMTYEERYDTWLKMRDAATPAERYAVWAKKRSELESRAAEHGMVLRDQPPMAIAREERYGNSYTPYGGQGAHYGQSYAAPYHQQRQIAPERPAPTPGWVGPHFFGVMPHMMPPVGR